MISEFGVVHDYQISKWSKGDTAAVAGMAAGAGAVGYAVYRADKQRKARGQTWRQAADIAPRSGRSFKMKTLKDWSKQ